MKKEIKDEIEKAIEDKEYRQRYAIWFVNQIFQNPHWFTTSARRIEKEWCSRMCCKCQKIKHKKSFYSVKNNVVYESGKLPICKKCINKLYHYYKWRYGSAYQAMEKICQLFNIYFDDRLFKNCDWDSESAVGIYLSKLNLKQNRFQKDYDATKKTYFKFTQVGRG